MQISSKAELAVKPYKDKLVDVRMSSEARKTMMALIEWGLSQISLFPMPGSFMEQFMARYSQIRFEEADQMYITSEYVKLIAGAQSIKPQQKYKPKTQEDVIKAVSLDLIFDPDWMSKCSITSRHQGGSIRYHEELYYWLSKHFLVNDFPIQKLILITQMGSLSDLSAIKLLAAQQYIISDKEKCNLDYLYKVVDNHNQAAQTMGRRASEASKLNSAAVNSTLDYLKKLADDSLNKTPMKPDPDRVARWEREREYQDAFRDLLKDLE